MRYVIFSDIHGNQYTLEKMILLTMKQVQGYVFLGDVCGYYYGQEKCIELLLNLNNVLYLRGNHDENYLEMVSGKKKKNDLVSTYGNSYLNILTQKSLDYLNNTKRIIIKKICGKNVLFVHGGINNYLKERIYPNQIEQYYQTNKMCLDNYDYIFTGHTHYNFIYKSLKGTCCINPGSLGQPRNKKKPSFCIIDFSSGKIDMIYIDWEQELLIKEIENKFEQEKNKKYLIDVLKRSENKYD